MFLYKNKLLNTLNPYPCLNSFHSGSLDVVNGGLKQCKKQCRLEGVLIIETNDYEYYCLHNSNVKFFSKGHLKAESKFCNHFYFISVYYVNNFRSKNLCYLHYFTSKTCIHGHISFMNGVRSALF